MKTKFTLVELLIVIVIIVILVGIMLPAAGKVRAATKETQARAQMLSLSTALSQIPKKDFAKLMTKLDFASAPPYGSEYRELTNDGYNDLIKEMVAPKEINRRNLMFNFRQVQMLPSAKGDSADYFGWTDPWNNKFYIFWDHDSDERIVFKAPNAPDVVHYKSFIIKSAGEDKILGTDDDIELDK